MDQTTRWPNFSDLELRCRCGQCPSATRGKNPMDPDFMDRLQLLRTLYGKPMPLSSAYRCRNHPAEAGKAEPGEHCAGTAVDVRIRGADALELLHLALTLGFNRIGVSQKGTARFLHLGVSPIGGRLPSPMIWSY